MTPLSYTLPSSSGAISLNQFCLAPRWVALILAGAMFGWLPALLWIHLLDGLDQDDHEAVRKFVREKSYEVNNANVREALENGVEVPGARLVKDRYALVRS